MRILIVSSRFPLPPWRGNQVRSMEWLEALDGHERTLMCPQPATVELGRELEVLGIALRPLVASALGRAIGLARSALSGRPMQEGLYDTRQARQQVRRAVQELRPELMIVQMLRCGWAADAGHDVRPEQAVLFDAIDAMGLHFERAAESVPALLRPVYRAEAARCRRRERQLADRARITTAVSLRDLGAIAPPEGRGRVVPVAGREMPVAESRAERPTVLLSGNLGYRPTVLGTLWFARYVWPALRERLPEARWLLVGARPPRSIRRLAAAPGAEIHADVPELAPFLAEATVAIAPMASGSGLPMKVLEAWAAGVPVVADPWTAAGLEDGADEAVATAATDGEWIEALTRLLTDPVAARELGEAGRRRWRQRYHPDRVKASVRKAVLAAAAGNA